jgi:hypothetical protein
MKATTKRKIDKFVKKALPLQALAVGAYIEINWLVSQWETVKAMVSGALRLVGIAG